MINRAVELGTNTLPDESLEILKQIQYEINKFLNMSTTRASKEAGETASKKVAGTIEEQVRGAKPNKALQKDKAVESDIIRNEGRNTGDVTNGLKKKIRTPKPSLAEIKLAKASGNTAAHIVARDKVSRHYLENNGFSESQIIEALGSENKIIKGGVDLNKPLEVMKFPPPEEMYQYVKSHGNPGNWFDPLGKQTADSLGINGATRTAKAFKVPKGDGLLSRSKPILDDWTVPGNPMQTKGGGVQVFVNNQIKNNVL